MTSIVRLVYPWGKTERRFASGSQSIAWAGERTVGYKVDFALSEQQELLRHSAREFLAVECTGSVVRQMELAAGHSGSLWDKLGRLGWIGLPVPAEHGGGGADFLDIVVLLEEIGRACGPSAPYSTMVLGALTLVDMADEAQKRRFLPAIASGAQIWTMALGELPDGSPERVGMAAGGQGHSLTLSGTKVFVTDAHISDHIICVARAGPNSDLVYAVVPGRLAGLRVTPQRTMAGDVLCQVDFDRVAVAPEDVLSRRGDASQLESLVQRAGLGLCAQIVGGCQRALEKAVDYARQRVQFGRPIGSFQAIQHHCANALVDVECARFLTYKASWMVANSAPCSKEASMAKGWVSQAGVRATVLCQQVNGGVGLTRDSDMQLYYRKVRAYSSYLGTPGFHYDIVARELGLEGYGRSSGPASVDRAA